MISFPILPRPATRPRLRHALLPVAGICIAMMAPAVAQNASPAPAQKSPGAAIIAPAPVRILVPAGTVFPAGLRIGLTPASGLIPAEEFTGFENADKTIKLILTELPAGAFADIENAVKSDQSGSQAAAANAAKPQNIETAAGPAYFTSEAAKDGTAAVRRYSMIVRGDKFSGYVAMQVPQDDADFSEDAVRKMFATAAVRKDVPVDEQLGMMPFKISDLSGFKHIRMLAPGSVLLLADDDGSGGIETSPFMVLGIIPSTANNNDDRGRLAQQAAGTIPGLREARITMSEPIRIDGAPGYETRINAISGKNDTPVTVVQWLRFGGSSSALRIIGSSSQADWPKAFPRFRTVRDAIGPR